jgi:hypothetical protein
MDVSSISEVISTVGFPIVCFLLCGWYVKYREDKNDEKYDKLNNQHDDEMKQIVAALNNNTVALQKLADKLGG